MDYNDKLRETVQSICDLIDWVASTDTEDIDVITEARNTVHDFEVALKLLERHYE